MSVVKLFISYSHDSVEHKNWVLKLATQLRLNGIDATLDIWDLRPGEDLTLFMERNILQADKVLIICSNFYVEKANSLIGGVGYEKMIVSGQMLSNLETNKFIPIIAKGNSKKAVPSFLSTKLYIDFSNIEAFEFSFKSLMYELLNYPFAKRPPLVNSYSFLKPTLNNEFVPFEHVNGIKPCYTKYSDVIRIFGLPDGTKKSDSGAPIFLFTKIGISLWLNKGADKPDAKVEMVAIERPYTGISPNGLRIGME